MNPMAVDLSGRTALVTGGTRGIGFGIASALAKAGARVVLNYLQDQDRAQRAVERLRASGAQVRAIRADVRSAREVRKLISGARRQLGGPNILVNNVGSFIQKPLQELAVSEWREMIRSNLDSVFLCCREVLPLMRRDKNGRIVNIALANADRVHAYRETAAYSIAKTGVLILTRSLAQEQAAHGITVNAVSPGLVKSGSTSGKDTAAEESRIPMGRIGAPDDVAGAVLFLVGDRADYITGANITVSGGWGL